MAGAEDRDEAPLAEAYDRALALEKDGLLEEAAAAWREVLRLDPEDRGGAAVRLAALGAAPSPNRASPAAHPGCRPRKSANCSRSSSSPA